MEKAQFIGFTSDIYSAKKINEYYVFRSAKRRTKFEPEPTLRDL